MAKYEFDDFQANMLRRLVEKEIKRVRELDTTENVGGLRLSEKAAWLADLNHVNSELGKNV